MGAWMSKQFSGDWELIVKNREQQCYDVLETYEKEPDGQKAWKKAKVGASLITITNTL